MTFFDCKLQFSTLCEIKWWRKLIEKNLTETCALHNYATLSHRSFVHKKRTKKYSMLRNKYRKCRSHSNILPINSLSCKWYSRILSVFGAFNSIQLIHIGRHCDVKRVYICAHFDMVTSFIQLFAKTQLSTHTIFFFFNLWNWCDSLWYQW